MVSVTDSQDPLLPPFTVVFWQPEVETQVSFVHGLLSLQFSGGPPMQRPAWLHVSFVVQALPSVQDRPGTGVFTQPLAGLHVSSVHVLWSSQFGGGPPTHAPLALHWSFVVQALPSVQTRPGTGVFAQPVAGLHESSVHGLLSLQFGGGPPTHCPVALH
jgi:hypothetical protein